MKATRLAVVGALAVACGPGVRGPKSGAADVQRQAPQVRQEYCASYVNLFDEPRCLGKLTLEQVRRRQYNYRLTFEAGHVARWEYLNGRGTPLTSFGETSSAEYRYENGRVREVASFDEYGVLHNLNRITEDGATYWYRDPHGRLLPLKDCDAVGAVREFSPEGRVLSHTYIDRNQERTSDEEGRVAIAELRDEAGALIERRYLGANGQPSLSKNGVHIERFDVNGFGAAVMERNFGLDDEPILDHHGVHQTVREFDTDGNLMRTSYFGLQGEPVRSSEWGFHQERYERNEHGEEVARAYFGVRGEPVLSRSNYHRYVTERDEIGLAHAWRYYGTYGEPVTVWDGQHRTVNEYENRRLVRRRYLAEDGDPISFTHESEFAIQTFEYDEQGNQTAERYFDARGEPVDVSPGHAVELRSYDDPHRLTRVRYEKADGTAGLTFGGFYSEKRIVYHDDGTVTAELYFDDKGQPIERVRYTVVAVRFQLLETESLPETARAGIEALRPGGTRPKEKARAIAALAAQELRTGAPGRAVLNRHSDQDGQAGWREQGGWRLEGPGFTPDAHDVEHLDLKPGEVAGPLEGDGVFWVLRLEATPTPAAETSQRDLRVPHAGRW